MNLNYRAGDERIINRLLTFLNGKTDVYEIRQLRKNVFFLHTSEGEFILKGFISLKRLELQKDFTHALRQLGFQQAVLFMTKSPIFVSPYFYGWQTYIESGLPTFHYRYERDRQDGLRLLTKYHRRTEILVPQFQNRLQQFRLLNKWQKRFTQFLAYSVPYLQTTIPRQYVDELIRWGNEGLAGMKTYREGFQLGNQVILHGDVAHHNFIRASDRRLFLIDFDLIQIGDASADYLQYANRILPSIGWSFEKLSSYAELQPYLKNKAFLYALMFPTDLYREWNRLLGSKQLNMKQIQRLLNSTLNQFSQRKQFMVEVRNMLN